MQKNSFLILILVVLAGLAAWYFRNIVIYIVVAGILSLIGQPVDRFYGRINIGGHKPPASLSAGLAFLSLLSVFLVLAAFFVPLVTEETQILSSLDKRTLFASLQQPIESAGRFLNKFNIDMEGRNLPSYIQEKLVSFLTLTNISLFFNRLIGVLGNFFTAFFAISFFTFFFLRDGKYIKETLFSMVPEKYAGRIQRAWQDSEAMLKRYFIGLLIEISLIMLFLSIGLWIAGINYFVLIALFAGLASIIPYIGPLIGVSFSLLIGLTTVTDMSFVAIVGRIILIHAGTYIADAAFLQPLIYSNSVKAHPLEIFLVILVGGTLGGIGGMILAVPGYTVVRVIAKEFLIRFRIVKNLMGKSGPEK